LKLNGTHQLLAHAVDVNLLGDNIDTLKENTETLIDASKEIGLKIHAAVSSPERRSISAHKYNQQTA
jgi:hypothetical protein